MPNHETVERFGTSWLKRTLILFGLAAYLLSYPVPYASAESKTLTVALATADYPPFYFVKDGALTGASLRLAEAVAKAAGYRLEYQRLPWARVLRTIEIGGVDMAIHMFNSPDRAKVALFTSIPHLYEDSTLFTITGKRVEFQGDLRSLKPTRIGMVRGYSHGEEYDTADYLSKVPMPSEHELIRGLHDGFYDVAIGNPPAILHHAATIGIREQIRLVGAPIDRGPVYFAISRHHPHAHEVVAALTRSLVAVCGSGLCAKILGEYGMSVPETLAPAVR